MNGVINFIKPPAMSSGGAVGFIKGLLNEKRVGHAGTLDPGAAGVLPVLVGRSTRLSEHLMSMGKEYIGEVRFGISTDTLDSYGSTKLISECNVSEEDFKSVIKNNIGDVWQVPPAYSAVKIDGTASYKLARSGNNRLKPKPKRMVHIYSADFLYRTEKNCFLFKTRCSKGTYVRVLAEEFGKQLGVPSHLSFLLRTESGGQRIESGYTADELKAMAESGNYSFIIPPEQIELGTKDLHVGAAEAEKLKNGLPLERFLLNEGVYRVFADSSFLGIGEIKASTLKLKITLY